MARYKRRDDVETYLMSDEFSRAVTAMSPFDRRVVWETAAKHMRSLGAFVSVPMAPPFTLRMVWSKERLKQLREIADTFGIRPGLDKAIATKLQVPLAAATLARYREVGRIRAAQSTRKPRAGGTHGGRARSQLPRDVDGETPGCLVSATRRRKSPSRGTPGGSEFAVRTS
jgi:hypothetical protein